MWLTRLKVQWDGWFVVLAASLALAGCERRSPTPEASPSSAPTHAVPGAVPPPASAASP